MVAATLSDVGRHLRLHRRHTGRVGLDAPNWPSVVLTGSMYELGRLQFDLKRQQDDWVLDVHIPESGPLTPAAVGDSFDSAMTFFARHFPDQPVRTAVCESWLLDPYLAEHLPPTSNVVAFARCSPRSASRGTTSWTRCTSPSVSAAWTTWIGYPGIRRCSDWCWTDWPPANSGPSSRDTVPSSVRELPLHRDADARSRRRRSRPASIRPSRALAIIGRGPPPFDVRSSIHCTRPSDAAGQFRELLRLDRGVLEGRLPGQRERLLRVTGGQRDTVDADPFAAERGDVAEQPFDPVQIRRA